MEDLETKLVDLLGKLEDAAVEISPEIVELGATAVFWDGVISIASGVVALLIGVAFLCVAKVYFGNFATQNKKYHNSGPERDDGSTNFLVIVPCTGAAFFFCFFALINLLEANPWLKVIEPKAALVKQFFLG